MLATLNKNTMMIISEVEAEACNFTKKDSFLKSIFPVISSLFLYF